MPCKKTPAACGGVITQSPCIVIENVDQRHHQALACGVDIVMAPVDQDYGGRLYSCRDPEGHLWNFRSCDPWA